jgi:hypothetical protein
VKVTDGGLIDLNYIQSEWADRDRVSGVSYKLSENRKRFFQTNYKEYNHTKAGCARISDASFIVLERKEKNVYSILCNNTTSDEHRTHLEGKRTGA